MAAERIGPALLAEALAAPTRLRGALLGDLGGDTASAGVPGEEDLSGSHAGPYLLQRCLARGGMGDVYFAADPSGATLTVKVLRRGMDSAALVRRSHRERAALAALRHRSIVELRDTGVLADGRPFLVTSFIAGGHLDVHCREHRLGARAIAVLMLQVCAAVQHAHARSIVHRDLKPANILVGADGVPVVLDFGVALLLAGEPGEGTVTFGCAPLTPYYASPELLLGMAASPRADVFALGVILRDLLTAAAPGGPPRLRHRLLQLASRSASADPLDRHRDAGHLATDLQRVLCGQRAGTAWRWRGLLRRHRRSVAMLTIVAIGLAVAGYGMHASAARARIAKVEALSVSEFLVRLLDRARPGDQGGDVTLTMALRAAEDEIPATFRGKPEGEYRVRMAYGRAYALLGDRERATGNLQRAIELLEADPDAFPESLVWCRNLLARCRAGG